MTTHTHATAPTRYIEAQGVRYAYRRFGAETGVPLLMLSHFQAGMDHWDPLVADGLAPHRPSSCSTTPESARPAGRPRTPLRDSPRTSCASLRQRTWPRSISLASP